MVSQEELNRQNEINNALERRASLERELVDILSRRVGIDSQNVIAQQDIGNTLADQLKNLKDHTQEKRSIRNITTQLNNLSREAYSIGVETLGNEKERNKVLKQITDAESNIRILNLQRAEFARKAANATGEERLLYIAIADSLKEQVEESVDLNKQLKETVALSEKISNNFGVKTFGALSDITKKIPGLSRFSEPFQQAEEAAKKVSITNASIDKFKALRSEGIGLSEALAKTGLTPSQALAGKSSPLLAGVKSLGPALTKALSPVILIVELIKGITQADKETTELQKSMGLTKDQASGFRMNLASAAAGSNNLNITTTKLLETYNSINKQFGFIVRFSDETLVNTTRLTKQVGLSTEAANALAGLTERQGSNAEELYETTVGTVLQLQKQSGIQIDQREIFEQIGKTTGTIRANLGSNPITIATAIQKSKEFGASLQDVANAGKALLDFESSITSELEAELLLGKNINLEKARAAALAGDQVTLAQELQQQAGSFSNFSAMNVIQQEALAKAMGMSSDQLADILYQQDLQSKGAEKVRAELMATGQEDAVRALDAQSAQDKFNATVEKLQGVFADVGTAFMPILQLFGDLLSLVNLIIAPITDLVQLIVGLGRVTAGAFSGNLLGNTDAFSEIKFSTPQALGMETADEFGATQSVQDGIAPPNRGPFTVTDSYGATAITTRGDGIAVSPNINQGSDNAEAKRTNQYLQELIKLSARPSVFQIGTDEFYTRTAKYSYQVQ
jgi:plasmid maintenance system antidote protein VapI